MKSKIQKEKWADTIHFGWKYEISDNGILRNKLTKKLYKPSKDTYGYFKITLNFKGKRINISIHRLMYLSFYPDTPLHLQIHHLDHNKINNILSNLGPIDPRAHSSIHSRMRILNGTFNLGKGIQHPCFLGKIVALCPQTHEIKHVMEGRYHIESLGFCDSGVYRAVHSGKKYKGFLFKRITNNSNLNIGKILDSSYI